MTSSNGNIFRVTGPLCGEFTGPGEFPTQRPVTRSFDVYFDLRLNKRLCKQSWGWWFETLLCPLWRHSNVLSINMLLPLNEMVNIQWPSKTWTISSSFPYPNSFPITLVLIYITASWSIQGLSTCRGNTNTASPNKMFSNFIVMMTSSNGNIFRVTGHLCGKFTGPRWISRTKASDAELWCFLWFTPE